MEHITQNILCASLDWAQKYIFPVWFEDIIHYLPKILRVSDFIYDCPSESVASLRCCNKNRFGRLGFTSKVFEHIMGGDAEVSRFYFILYSFCCFPIKSRSVIFYHSYLSFFQRIHFGNLFL